MRTFADWHEPLPGHFEVDFVAHNGGLSTGSCVHSLVLTDIASGWTECVALVVHEQSLLVEALGFVEATLPVPLLGIDTDNDSVFMNDTVIEHCRTAQLSDGLLAIIASPASWPPRFLAGSIGQRDCT